MTRQLLTFGRRGVVKTETLNPGHVIANTEAMFRRLLREDIAFDVHVAADTRCLRADSGQFEQVILNLLVNARDAMSTGGQLTLTCTNAGDEEEDHLGHPFTKPGPHVKISVQDTGQGMDADTFHHIFEPFFTTKPPGKGTGLGLATVYGIVTAMNADLEVKSAPDRGSTFTIYFPSILEDTPAPLAAPEVKGTRGDEVILVCEDEELVRTLVCQFLRAAGYEILEAENGADALKVVEEYSGKIDMLVTDVIMPIMNGKELADSLEQSFPELGVLFLSGYTADVVDEGSLSRKGRSFLQKPFTREQFLGQVREALDKDSEGL